jgi:uncharacterized membrane protein
MAHKTVVMHSRIFVRFNQWVGCWVALLRMGGPGEGARMLTSSPGLSNDGFGGRNGCQTRF